MEGSISLPRSILNRGWGNNPIIFYVFVNLVMRANWKDEEWQGIVIRRGELVTSVRNLAHELRITDNQVKYALCCLQKDKQIFIKSTNKFSNITICDYDSYQHSQKTNSQTVLQATSKTEVNNRINKESNKEEKKETNVSKEKAVVKKNDIVERLYALYPTHCPVRNASTSKGEKSKRMLASLLTRFSAEEIEARIKYYLGENYGKRYIKDFSTLLNDLPEIPSQSLFPAPPQEAAAPLPKESYDEAMERAKNPTEEEIKEHINSSIKPFHPKPQNQTDEEYEADMRYFYEKGKQEWILDRIAFVNKKIYG